MFFCLFAVFPSLPQLFQHVGIAALCRFQVKDRVFHKIRVVGTFQIVLRRLPIFQSLLNLDFQPFIRRQHGSHHSKKSPAIL